jgi:hypothetical protein
MKILLTAIAVTAVSALGAPYGPNIPLPTYVAGVYTSNNNKYHWEYDSLQWLSDSYFLGNKMVGYHHSWLACESFELVIGGGNVHGTATYRP